MLRNYVSSFLTMVSLPILLSPCPAVTLDPVARFSTQDSNGDGIYEQLNDGSSSVNPGLPQNARIAHVEYDLNPYAGETITSAFLDFSLATNNNFHQTQPSLDHDRDFDVNLFLGNGIAELNDSIQTNHVTTSSVTYHNGTEDPKSFSLDVTNDALSLLGDISENGYLGVSLVGLPTDGGSWGPSLFRGDGLNNAPQLRLEFGTTGNQGPGFGSYHLFETAKATPDDPVSNGGIGVDSSFYSGIGFRVERTTVLSQVGAYLFAGSGTVFAAVVELENQFDLPDPYDLSGSDVLGTTLLELPPGFDGSDVVGDLPLTLEPGAYALLLGSGKFGATGDALLRSSHIPNGNWSEYSIRQSDGTRFFQAGAKRMFAVAESALGTVQIRPTYDAVAEVSGENVVQIIDQEDGIFVGVDAGGPDPDQRALLGFSLADVPPGREIASVTLELDLNLLTFSDSVEFDIYGIAGDGEIESSDATTMQAVIGTTSFDDVGLVSVDLDPEFVENLVGNASHLELLIVPNGFDNFRFSTLEGGEFGEPPLLTINLAPPNDGDLNGDGFVNGRDAIDWLRGNTLHSLSPEELAAWEANFGLGTNPLQSTTIPEPSTGVALALATALLVARREMVFD